MSSSKKLTCKGTLRQVFTCLRPSTLPLAHCICVYSTVYLFTLGRGGGGGERELTRAKGKGATVHKAGSQIPTFLNVRKKLAISSLHINSDKHLPPSPFTGKFF